MRKHPVSDILLRIGHQIGISPEKIVKGKIHAFSSICRKIGKRHTETRAIEVIVNAPRIFVVAQKQELNS
ncbi:hypothetical protein EVA_06383 [gut metagenome]|uniref:Uncharacterized protein n=1 Tax=gut metagenome TaxID=749906 RepID=J9GDS3_9ZZZZ